MRSAAVRRALNAAGPCRGCRARCRGRTTRSVSVTTTFDSAAPLTPSPGMTIDPAQARRCPARDRRPRPTRFPGSPRGLPIVPSGVGAAPLATTGRQARSTINVRRMGGLLDDRRSYAPALRERRRPTDPRRTTTKRAGLRQLAPALEPAPGGVRHSAGSFSQLPRGIPMSVSRFLARAPARAIVAVALRRRRCRRHARAGHQVLPHRHRRHGRHLLPDRRPDRQRDLQPARLARLRRRRKLRRPGPRRDRRRVERLGRQHQRRSRRGSWSRASRSPTSPTGPTPAPASSRASPRSRTCAPSRPSTRRPSTSSRARTPASRPSPTSRASGFARRAGLGHAGRCADHPRGLRHHREGHQGRIPEAQPGRRQTARRRPRRVLLRRRLSDRRDLGARVVRRRHRARSDRGPGSRQAAGGLRVLREGHDPRRHLQGRRTPSRRSRSAPSG